MSKAKASTKLLPFDAARYLTDDAGRTRIADRGADVVRQSHTYAARLAAITPRLRAFASETRAWAFWDQFMLSDPTRALRFVEALRADRTLLREDLWHVADTTAHMRLGRWDVARRSLELARRVNPALLRLRQLDAALETH